MRPATLLTIVSGIAACAKVSAHGLRAADACRIGQADNKLYWDIEHLASRPVSPTEAADWHFLTVCTVRCDHALAAGQFSRDRQQSVWHRKGTLITLEMRAPVERWDAIAEELYFACFSFEVF